MYIKKQKRFIISDLLLVSCLIFYLSFSHLLHLNIPRRLPSSITHCRRPFSIHSRQWCTSAARQLLAGCMGAMVWWGRAPISRRKKKANLPLDLGLWSRLLTAT